MTNNFFNDSNKAYSENLNDGILVGNAFDWTVDVSLPTDTGGVFPNSSTIVMAKVADVYISPNSNLSIGSTISNSSGSSQVYRLTVYPNFNRYGGFKSISVTASSGVTFYIANKGASTPIANNLDYSDLSSVPELKVLKEYDIVLTIPNGKSVSGLEFVFQTSSADVSGSISPSNVTGLSDSLTTINTQVAGLINANDEILNYDLSVSDYNPIIDSTVTVTCRVTDFYGEAVSGESVTLYCNGSSVSTSITNNMGVATWIVTCDSWGLQTFTAGNGKIQVNVYGWKTVSLGISYATFYVNEAIRECELRYVREFSAADGDKFYTWHTSAIPENYRPSVQVNGSINQVGIIYVDSTGEIGGKFANTFSSTRTCKGSVMWHY